MPRSESYIESVDRAIYEGDSDEDESKWSSPLVAARNGVPELSPIRKRGWTMLLLMACLRLVVAPLLCMAMLAAMVRNLFKGLHRDLVVYPRELVCGPNASAVVFGLQLTLQIWLGALFAITYGIAGSIFVPVMCLLGFGWATILNALTKHKMERPLASNCWPHSLYGAIEMSSSKLFALPGAPTWSLSWLGKAKQTPRMMPWNSWMKSM